jgi:hypothetical protein
MGDSSLQACTCSALSTSDFTSRSLVLIEDDGSLAHIQKVVDTDSPSPNDTKLVLLSFASIVLKQGPRPKVKSLSADNTTTIYNNLQLLLDCFSGVAASPSINSPPLTLLSSPQTSLFSYSQHGGPPNALSGVFTSSHPSLRSI